MPVDGRRPHGEIDTGLIVRIEATPDLFAQVVAKPAAAQTVVAIVARQPLQIAFGERFCLGPCERLAVSPDRLWRWGHQIEQG